MAFLFDAVLFDLDGTLIASDVTWLPAARTGAAEAFAELGLQRELPDDAEWLGLIGAPLVEGFARLFPDLSPDQRQVVMRRCTEREDFALRAGRGALLPGAREALDELRGLGVRMGIASNCSRSYLDAAMERVGLARWIEEARCLDSPGCATKGRMVADLLRVFAPRRACFVGDRASDAEAAEENGLPFVWVTEGFAQPGERVRFDAAVTGLGGLVECLGRLGAGA